MPKKDRLGLTMLSKDAEYVPVKRLLEIMGNPEGEEPMMFFSFHEIDGYVVVDNTDHNAWTESFEKWEDALRYIQGESMEDIAYG